jgi:hypothetical protein
MSKYSVIILFSIISAIALAILVMSIGWYLPIFTVVLIPTIIMHVLAGIKAYQKQPEFNVWIILSAIAILGFVLFRPDTDAHGGFTGYSSLMYHLGINETEHTEPFAYSLELALVFLLAQIFCNTVILLRKSGKMN